METDWIEKLITQKKPFKGEVIEIGKMLSKEYFRIYLEDNNKNLEVLEDDIIVMGFKEFEDTYMTEKEGLLFGIGKDRNLVVL